MGGFNHQLVILGGPQHRWKTWDRDMRSQENAIHIIAPSIACGILSVHGKSILVLEDTWDSVKGEDTWKWLEVGAPLLSPETNSNFAPAKWMVGRWINFFPGAWRNLAGANFLCVFSRTFWTPKKSPTFQDEFSGAFFWAKVFNPGSECFFWQTSHSSRYSKNCRFSLTRLMILEQNDINLILPPISSTLCQPSTAEILTHFVEQQCVQGSTYGPLPFCSGDLFDLFWHLLTAGSDFVGAFFVFFWEIFQIYFRPVWNFVEMQLAVFLIL